MRRAVLVGNLMLHEKGVCSGAGWGDWLLK